MEDIQIIVSRGRAVIASLTQRGLNWLKNNMTEESPVTVEAEYVPEIRKKIEADGLTVKER